MTLPLRRFGALLSALLLSLGVAACAKTVSTSSFKGEQQEVAKTISNLQSDVTAGEKKKICTQDLSSALVGKLSTASGGCEQAIKNQLSEVDGFELNVESITVNSTGTPPTATAHVQSVYSGKKRLSTLSLVKEGGKWKISGLE
jgi:copper chaperone CopZ